MGGGSQGGLQGSMGERVHGWRTGSQGSEEGTMGAQKKRGKGSRERRRGFKGLGRKVFGTGT